MRKQATRPVWVMALALVAGMPSLARAQYPTSAGSTRTGTYGASPATNPYMNPFLNPYMMQANASQPNGLLYFAAASQITGLGSGRISGSRPDPAAALAPPEREQAARAPGVPTGRTARYFNRSYDNGGRLGRYYSRRDSYFPTKTR